MGESVMTEREDGDHNHSRAHPVYNRISVINHMGARFHHYSLEREGEENLSDIEEVKHNLEHHASSNIAILQNRLSADQLNHRTPILGLLPESESQFSHN